MGGPGSGGRCPNDGTALRTGTRAGADVLGCERCGGRAIPVAALRKATEPEIVDPILRRARADVGRGRGKRCPRCRAPMTSASLTQRSGRDATIDVCAACEQVWLDDGELPFVGASGPDPTMERARAIVAFERSTKVDDSPPTIGEMAGTFLGAPMARGVDGGRGVPWVTVSILVACAIASVAAWNDDSLFRRFGHVPSRDGPLALTSLTSIFLHVDAWHLVGNALFLWLSGRPLERLLGRARFALVFFAAAFGGDALTTLVSPDQAVPSVGASGGIFGALIVLAFCFPKGEILMSVPSFVLPRFRFVPLPLAALAWIAMQFWIAFRQAMDPTTRPVGVFAHLGGAVVGIVLGFAFRPIARRRENARVLGP